MSYVPASTRRRQLPDSVIKADDSLAEVKQPRGTVVIHALAYQPGLDFCLSCSTFLYIDLLEQHTTFLNGNTLKETQPHEVSPRPRREWRAHWPLTRLREGVKESGHTEAGPHPPNIHYNFPSKRRQKTVPS